jgi:hypothetical protein
MLIVSLLVLTPQRLSYGERVRTINRPVASALTTLVCAMQISGASGQPPTAHASVADLFDRAMREWKTSFGVSRAGLVKGRHAIRTRRRTVDGSDQNQRRWSGPPRVS